MGVPPRGLMFCNLLNSEILESPAVTLKHVLVAVTNSANRTNCVRNKILQPVRTGNSVGDNFYRECDRKVCGYLDHIYESRN